MSYSCIDFGSPFCDGCCKPGHAQGLAVVRCGKEWMSNGKDHKCVRPENESHRCTCDCGEKIPSAKRPQPPLKLAHWKRGRKKVFRVQEK